MSKRFSKIISINLTETLICDLLLLEKDGFAESNHIGIAISVREINQLLNDEIEINKSTLPKAKDQIDTNDLVEQLDSKSLSETSEMSTKEISIYYFYLIK